MLLGTLVILPLLVDADHPFNPYLPPETHVNDIRGFELHRFQLIRPYSNAPYWDLRGDAFVSRSKIRLTRESQSLNGSIWSKDRVSARDWEIQADLRILGTSAPPADGVAIWYVAQPDTGTAWGGPANFSGIAVVLDTYKNAIEGKSSRQSSRLFVILNYHTKVLDSTLDGDNLRLESECSLGNDPVSYRTPYDHSPTIRILIRYVHERLQVFFALPSRAQEHWQYCTNSSFLFLPINYHVGVSAATGDLKSTHELLSLRVYQIDTPPHYIQNPVNVPMYFGANTDNSEPEELSFWDQLFFTVEIVIVAVLVCGTLYIMYYITDKYVDESFIMARPRRRFY